MRTKVIVSLSAMLFFAALSGAKAEDDPATEYAKRLERANPEADPQQHKALATWCKRHYPEKFELHQNAFNEYQFKALEDGLPAKPGASDFKRLSDAALKLDLPAKSREYLGKWGEIQYAGFAQRLKAGDVKMMESLLKWTIDQGVSFIAPAQQLAGDILKLDETWLPARKVLGHIEIDGKWQTVEEAFKGIDLRDPEARVAIHRKLADANKEVRKYPASPFKGMEKVGNYYLTGTAASGGQAKYFVVELKSSPGKPCPLIISLHGGGSGGFEKAREYAAIAAGEWVGKGVHGGGIVIAPIARQHVTNSWGTLANAEDLVDAIEETLGRFNIDRKRIYVTGQSMGGGGTSLYYLCLPELAAASCARAGFYFRDDSVKSVLGKPIMVIQGEKDEAFRLQSRDALVKQVEKLEGKLTMESLPDVDHFIPAGTVMQRMLPYFEDHVNDIEPDFRLIRAAVRAWFK